MAKHDDEQTFERWLNEQNDKKGSYQDEDPFEFNDQAWSDRQAIAQQLTRAAEAQKQSEVPYWNRESTFDNSMFATKSSSNWLSISSLAFSCCALFMVLFRVEFSIGEQGFLVSFAGTQADQRIAQAESRQQFAEQQLKQVTDVLDSRLKDFVNEQKIVLANYSSELQTKQQDSNLQLVSYVLSTSRQERKEDLSDLVKFLSEQRRDEQLSQNIKFKQLEQAVLWQQTASNPINPASWQVEE